MKINQAKGYIFEKIIWDLLKETSYVKVKTRNLRGRGADHQIDAYGILEYPTAFIYPIRLIAEAKCYESKIDLTTIRSFFGVIQDITEKYSIIRGRRNFSARYTDVGCIFSTSSFSKPAQDFAWAHNIFLISFEDLDLIKPLLENINNFIQALDSGKNIVDGEINLTKKEIRKQYTKFRKYNNSFPSLAIGILNNTYPVILIGENGWTKNIYPPVDSDQIFGVKTQRIPCKSGSGTIFELIIDGQRVFFNLQYDIADRIGKKIDGIINENNDADYQERKIFELDILIKFEKENGTTRRLLKVNVNLPKYEMDKYYNDLSSHMNSTTGLTANLSTK